MHEVRRKFLLSGTSEGVPAISRAGPARWWQNVNNKPVIAFCRDIYTYSIYCFARSSIASIARARLVGDCVCFIARDKKNVTAKVFFSWMTTTTTTESIVGPTVGAEVAHVSRENGRGSITDGAIDFVAGSLGKCPGSRFIFPCTREYRLCRDNVQTSTTPINLNRSILTEFFAEKFPTILLIR